MVDQVRNPPFAFQCAWRYDQWTAADSAITYDRLTSNAISGGGIYNVTGGLDINTGVFTVGHGFSGMWAVTYTITSRQDNEDDNEVQGSSLSLVEVQRGSALIGREPQSVA